MFQYVSYNTILLYPFGHNVKDISGCERMYTIFKAQLALGSGGEAYLILYINTTYVIEQTALDHF